VVYMQSITGGYVLARINAAAPTTPELLHTYFASQDVLEPASHSLTADGTKMAFVAKSKATNTVAVYLVDFATRNTVRLTSDTANYPAVAIAPDGSLVAAVRNDGTATDLVLINVADAANNYPQISITTDGNTNVEAQPDFSPDGTLVTFSYTQGNPVESNLAVVRVAGGIISPVEPIMTVDGDDIYPQFSPDGVFVMFASNRAGGVYNLYVYDRNTRATYQMTEEDRNVFPGSWTP
jgi:Tol biopolymer transport system component